MMSMRIWAKKSQWDPSSDRNGVLGVAATLGCQLRLRDGNEEAKVRKLTI